MTTYATTYGWRSTRVREDLMTSPPEQNPVNGAKGDQRGSMGPLTLSLRTEKVAGSSPAERAPNPPANGHVALPRPEVFCSSRCGPPGVGTDFPFLKEDRVCAFGVPKHLVRRHTVNSHHHLYHCTQCTYILTPW